MTAGLVLLVANFVDLSAIASVGRAVALMIFILVGIAGWRRRADTGASPAIVILAIAVTAVVLGFFAVDTARNAPETFTAIVAIGVLAVVLAPSGRGRATGATMAAGRSRRPRPELSVTARRARCRSRPWPDRPRRSAR